jgi:hypothetical protein
LNTAGNSGSLDRSIDLFHQRSPGHV